MLVPNIRKTHETVKDILSGGEMKTNGVRYLVGVGGWEHDILDQCFYPTMGSSSARKLEFYARYFNTSEVRPTFWDASLGSADAREWALAVAGRRDFRFIVKLHSSLTHERTITAPVVRSMVEILRELQNHDRLGIALAQFPYAFTNTGAHRFHLEKLAAAFRGLPLHVELRHASWEHASVTKLLQELGVSPVHADLPRIKQFPVTFPRPSGQRAYFRMHGRNEKGWLLNGYDVRYDYLYNARELRESKRRVLSVPPGCTDAYVIWNNTTGGKALANALEMNAMLHDGRTLVLPASTLRAFPHLGKVHRPEEHTGSLFDGAYRDVG